MYLFLKADATVSIFMIILCAYLVSLILFLCIYFACICIHMHSTRCHVIYTIEFNIIIFTAQYGISQQSSTLHILYNYHPKILVLKIGWSLINCKDFTCIGKALGLAVHRLQISLWSNNLTNVIYIIISYILNDTVHISGPFCVIFKTFCLIVINYLFLRNYFFCSFVIINVFCSSKTHADTCNPTTGC